MPPAKPKPKPKPSEASSKMGGASEPAAATTQSDNAQTDTSAPSGFGSASSPQRLDTLNRATSATPSRGRGGPVARPRFAGRRSQAARAELEKEEAAKKAGEGSSNMRGQRRSRASDRGDGGGRGHSSRGRGRGGYANDASRLGAASGPFSAGHTSHDTKVRASGSGSGGGGSSGAFGGGHGSHMSRGPVKIEDGSGISSGSRSRAMKAEDGGYISSDDEGLSGIVLRKQKVDELQDRTVDLTGLDDDTSDNPLAPVRLRRVPVKERQVGLSAEVLSKRAAEHGSGAQTSDETHERKKGKGRARDVEFVGSSEKPRRAVAYSSSSDEESQTLVKEEPVDDEPAMDSVRTTTLTSIDENNRDAPSSPESRRKAKAAVKATVVDAPEDERPFHRPKTPPFATQHEIDEYRRSIADLDDIYNELGRMGPKSVKTGTTDNAGDVGMADEPAKTIRSDQIYLFQMPPHIPALHVRGSKEDREAHPDDVNDDEAMEDAPPTGDPSQQSAGVKAEDNLPPDLPPIPASGYVGKMRTYRSGKTTIDWGGIEFVLGKGIEMSSLQTVLMARVPKSSLDADPKADPDAEPEIEGRAWGMGPVKKKFILQSPEFADL